MQTHNIMIESAFSQSSVLIDDEFDRFEPSNDLRAKLNEAESDLFFHDTFDIEESAS